jgi:hypothetical protein
VSAAQSGLPFRGSDRVVVVDGASIFLIFNGIVISLSIAMYVSTSLAPLNNQIIHAQFFFIPFRALAGLKISSFSTSQVAFECAWTGIFTFLQIGTVQFAKLSSTLCRCRRH